MHIESDVCMYVHVYIRTAYYRNFYVFSVPPVIVGLEQSSFTVVEGGEIIICVVIENRRYSPVEVFFYAHIEGELMNRMHTVC